MKKLLLFGLLFFAPQLGRAATTFTISRARFRHDVDLGTFVVNGVTYGAITELQYTVTLADSVSSNSCSFNDSVTVGNPKLSFPTANTIKNVIQQAVSDQGIKKQLNKCLSEKNSPSAIVNSDVADTVPGVIGQTVTPP